MLHARGNACLNGAVPDNGALPPPGCAPDEAVLRAAFVRVIADFCDPGATPFIPALGLDGPGFRGMQTRLLPQQAAAPAWLAAQQAPVGSEGMLEEFRNLVDLLLAHRAVPDTAHREVAHLVATACMGSNHLWQDMGLPSRNDLSGLLAAYFPDLAAKNTGNMKWKKFFYRQLCEREGLKSCNRPSCAACCDYDACFGAEE